uniref:Uncharacterized protein n=1 Tax=Neisseria meningitidis alpha275 TaxID=295996 RepID=C6SLS9_NEIME|nr:hypothetical protein predicted by Glimmer/Critica [Neisseria meningitidis alpha275]
MAAASRGGWVKLANGLEKTAVSVGLLQVQAYGFVCVCALSVGHFRRRLCRLKRPAGDAAAFSIDKHIFRTRSGRGFPGAAADLFALI